MTTKPSSSRVDMDGGPFFEVGQRVKVSGLRGSFHVVSGPNKKKEYEVSLGERSLWVRVSSLSGSSLSHNPSKTKKKKDRDTPPFTLPERPPTPETLRVDLHGLTKKEAQESIEQAIDRALLGGSDRLEIIHGIGKGALAKLTKDYLDGSKHISRHKADDLNPGVRWAYLC